MSADTWGAALAQQATSGALGSVPGLGAASVPAGGFSSSSSAEGARNRSDLDGGGINFGSNDNPIALVAMSVVAVFAVIAVTRRKG